MRNYWLRIVLGALGIFLLGMLIWTGVRTGRDKVVEVVESDQPITIPLAFVPFTVDGRNLGTLSRVEIQRSSPEQVSAVNFTVKLADSVADEQLATCVLVAKDNLDHINPGRAFTCATAADTAGKDLAPVGQLETQRGGVFVLLARAGTLENLKFNMHGDAAADSATLRAELMVDSIEAAAESASMAADSMHQAADSIRNAAMQQADSARRAAHRMRDSIRREVRAQVQKSLQESRVPAAR